MTVTQQTPFNSYTASGVNDTFAFTFRILENSHLQVALDGNLQTEGVDYTIENLTDLGGDVVFTSTPPAATVVDLQRVTPVDQQVDYRPFDPFPAETHELALDKLTMIYQERQFAESQPGLPLHPSGQFWDAGNLRISDVGAPTGAADAATKAYVDAALGSPFDPADDQIITGNWQFNAVVRLSGTTTFNGVAPPTFEVGAVANNNQRYQGYAADGSTLRTLAFIGGSDLARFGDAALDSRYDALAQEEHRINNAAVARFVSAANGSLQIDRGDGTFEAVLTASGVDLSSYTQRNAAETITSSWAFSAETVFGANIRLGNENQLVGRNAANTGNIALARAGSDDTARFGSTANSSVIESSGTPKWSDGVQSSSFAFIDVAQTFSETQTFASTTEFQQSTRQANAVPHYLRDSGGTLRFMAQVTAADRMDFGDSNLPVRLQGQSVEVLHSAVQVTQTTTRALGSLLVRDINGNLKKVGYRNPQLTRSVSTSFTLAQTDEGQIVRLLFDAADRVITIPQLDGGTQIVLTNRSNLGIDDCIIAPDSGVTILVMQGNDQYNATGEIRMRRGTVLHCQWESSTIVNLWGSGVFRAAS